MSSKYSKRNKHSKEERVPTQWSDWEWDEDKRCYVRYRLDKYGDYEFDYDYDAPERNEHTARLNYQESENLGVPRYAPTHDATDGKSSQAVLGEADVIPEYTSSSYEDATVAFGNLELNKRKERDTEYVAPISSSSSVAPSVAQSLPAVETVEDGTWNIARSNSGYGARYPEDTGVSTYQQSSYPYGSSYNQIIGSSSYQQPFYNAQTWEGNNYHIGQGTHGLGDPLDSPFKVCHGSAFKVGNVFKILWAEPTGTNGTQLSDLEPVHSHSRKYKETFVHKIRRFVVVKCFTAHCVCLPIKTYGGQGTRKAGAQALHHAVIYSGKEVVDKGENLIKKAVRVEMSSPREKLDSASRINYARVYTIEYNVKVLFIGRVIKNHLRHVLADYHHSQGIVLYEHPDNLGGSSVPFQRPPTPSPLRSTKISDSSRRSSVDSVHSMVVSSALAPSSTTASSFETASGGAQRLSEFLLAQHWLQILSRDALKKVSPSRFEQNLRRSLVQFSAHLKEEATLSAMIRSKVASPTMIKAAGTVRKLARNVASLFRQALEKEVTLSDEENVLPINTLTPFEEDHEDENYQDDQDDEDDEDDDLLEYKEEVYEQDSQKLEVVLSKSMAFRLLEENLQLFVHSDPIKKTLFQIWPISLSRDSPFEVINEIEWQVPNFLRAHFPDGQELGNILTITGASVNAQAQSCIDYLTSTWPDIGPVLLDALQQLLSLQKEEISEASDIVSLGIKLGPSSEAQILTSCASVAVVGNYAVHEQVISALSWISAAVRHSPHQEMVLSSTSVSAKKSTGRNPHIGIQLLELERVQTNESCWHSLVPHAVIAKGFRIRKRTAGQGLEISFANMAMLSQSRSFTEFDDGLIVEGLRSVLIPTKVLPEDDAIQWHLEYKRQTEPPKKRSIAQILAMPHIFNRYKSQKPDELFHKRCFLGWAEEVVVMIGTREFSRSEVYKSEATLPPRTRRVKSNNIAMGISCLGIVGANGSKTWQETFMPSNVTLEINKDIYDTLADDSDQTVLIYDTREQTAWLLPHPSVILYLIHKILARRKFQLFDGDRETEFKFAEPSWDAASEASSILHEIIGFKVRKSSKFKEDLSETVKDVCFLLDFLGDRLDEATSEFELIDGSEKANIYGFELSEVIHMKNRFDIMQARIDQPWTQMVRKRGMVLFCAGLAQAISPVLKSSASLCSTYQRVPPERNLLATTGAALHSFLEPNKRPNGCTVGNKVKWATDNKPLLRSHEHGQTNSVYHEQSLHIVETSTPDPSMLGSVSCHMSSGFIFTDHRSRIACSEGLVPAKSPPLPQLSGEVMAENEAISAYPQDDSGSDTSHDTDSGVNDAPKPSSSMSSDEFPQGKENSGQIIPPLSAAAVAGTWSTKNSRQDSAYVTDPGGDSPSRQISMESSSSSNTPRTAKGVGETILGTHVDKGKRPASLNEAVCHEGGHEMSGGIGVPRAAIKIADGVPEKNGNIRDKLRRKFWKKEQSG